MQCYGRENMNLIRCVVEVYGGAVVICVRFQKKVIFVILDSCTQSED